MSHSEPLSATRSLYTDYFQLLPSASKPLELVYRQSVSFSAQLLIAYTKLYPIFQANLSAMSLPLGGLSPIIQPPKPLISMIATWVIKRPELCHTAAPRIPESLPLLHQRISMTHIQSTPLTGVVVVVVVVYCLLPWFNRDYCLDHLSSTSPRTQTRDT